MSMPQLLHTRKLNMSLDSNLIPGASTLGFGINIAIAVGPTDTTSKIVTLDTLNGTPWEYGGITYLLPANVEPNLVGKTYLEYSSYTSESDYMTQTAASMSVSASGWGFSGEFDAQFGSEETGDSVSSYGLVVETVDLFSVKLDEVQGAALEPTFASELAGLPAAFTPETQQQFFDFFNKYGTHIIDKSVVGGRLHYAVRIDSASSFSEKEASANMTLEYDSVFVDAGATASAEWQKIDSAWFASRSCTLTSIGGDPECLAAAIPPSDPNNQVNYQGLVAQWTDSVKSIMAIVDYSIRPIYDVADVGKIGAMTTALEMYLNASVTANSALKVTEFQGIENGATSVMFGSTSIVPPVDPQPQLFSNAWIVMIDPDGKVQFNENVRSNVPADFDALVQQAQDQSTGRNWWTAVVYVTVPPQPLSEAALSFLRSCGVQNSDWSGYPSWPVQFVAVGMSNEESFPGQYAIENSPYYGNPTMQPGDWEQVVEATMPLYIKSI